MSSFGEIVEPGSRTAWEDWDDITPESNIIELKWHKNLEPVDNIEKFLVLEGKYLTDYVQKTLNLELINTIPEVHLQLFRSKVSNKYLCTIYNYNLVLSSEIVELLRPFIIVSKDVLTILTKGQSEYQTTEIFNQDCIIRAVATTKNLSMDLKFPKLEQPNIIYGVSAGVITLREHCNLAAIAIICYMEHPEEYRISEIEQLLEKLSIKQDSKPSPSHILTSNLYI